MKHRFNPASDTPQNAEASTKAPKKSKIKIITPTLLVFSTYALLLFSKIVDLTLLNRENEYYTVVILQLMIFLLPGAIWCKYRGEGYVKRLRMRLPKPSSFSEIIFFGDVVLVILISIVVQSFPYLKSELKNSVLQAHTII